VFGLLKGKSGSRKTQQPNHRLLSPSYPKRPREFSEGIPSTTENWGGLKKRYISRKTTEDGNIEKHSEELLSGRGEKLRNGKGGRQKLRKGGERRGQDRREMSTGGGKT